jgi:hypothetical protein
LTTIPFIGALAKFETNLADVFLSAHAGEETTQTSARFHYKEQLSAAN